MGQGFFDLGTGVTPETMKSKGYSKQSGCPACGLDRSCKTPRIPSCGKGLKKILIINESPEEKDDEEGCQCVGKAGEFLEDNLKKLNINLRRDCRVISAIKCHTKSPTPGQIRECRQNLLKEVSEFQPQVIITLGESSIDALIGHRLTGRLNGTSGSDFFGEYIPDQELGCWVCPTMHPLFILGREKHYYNEKDKSIENTFNENLKKAIELVNIPIPVYDWKKHCKIITSLDETIECLENILIVTNKYFITYDYETTGIKPHRQEHKIISASIGWDDKGIIRAIAFPFFNNMRFLALWKDILINPDIKKIAHKADFEATWTYSRAGNYWPDKVYWDTMLAAHCLHNIKPVGLKFQTYIKFGVLGYDSEVDEFITSEAPGEDKKSGNRFNLIQKAPLSKILLYNAADSYFTYILFQYQTIVISAEQKKGLQLLIDGSDKLARIQMDGIRMDEDLLRVQKEKLTKRILITEKKLEESEEVQKWNRTQKKGFNPNSNVMMSKLLYEILKYKRPEGNQADEDALNQINSPFTINIIQGRKFKKIRDTYLSQYEREVIDGILHPFFNLHTVSTFRSSSDSPNFQNVPKRDIQAKTIIRSLIRPSPGNKLIEYDYKGVEVSTGCPYHKDPKMIEYVTDPSTDMHRDTAMLLFFRKKEEVTKQERYLGKNGFVFPSFYGSVSKEIAPNIWEDMPEETKAHIMSMGIKTLARFTKHVENIEWDFWHKRFPVYAEWKQRIWADYLQKGYVDLYTGFRCYGPMKFTEVTNYPIQGSAFHILLWNLIQCQEPIKLFSGKSRIIGQIHDSLICDIYPEDEKQIDDLINTWGTIKVREHWPWINVSLKIEKESSIIDGSWDDMKEQKK